MDYSKLKDEICDKYKEIKIFFETDGNSIGLTYGGFHQTVRNESMKIITLERISKKLKKPMAYWWNDRVDYKDSEVNDIREEYVAKIEKTNESYEQSLSIINKLYNEIKEKEKKNEALQEKINELMGLNKPKAKVG